MTRTNDICFPTPLSIQVLGRPKDPQRVEPTGDNSEPEPTTAPAVKLEEDRLSA